jgi:ADP-L-glycero-D-manno-heptose 6-epimerase
MAFTQYKNKTVLVTGGTGFVGRNIVNALLKLPVDSAVKKIIVFDRTLKCTWGAVEQVELMQGDITTDMAQLASLDFDLVFHEAANVDTTCTDDDAMLRVNYYAFTQLVDLCQSKAVPLVYASSAATYGNTAPPNRVGQGEQPLNIYGCTKLMMDDYTRQHCATWTYPVVGLRYFNVYGPGEAHKGSMKSMIGQMLDAMRWNQEVKLFEFGEQRRDFVYVEDVAACNLLAGLTTRSGIYNCGSGRSVDFNTLFLTLRPYFPAYPHAEAMYIKNGYLFFQMETQADISSTRTDLKFEPAYDYVKGIERYVAESE